MHEESSAAAPVLETKSRGMRGLGGQCHLFTSPGAGLEALRAL